GPLSGGAGARDLAAPGLIGRLDAGGSAHGIARLATAPGGGGGVTERIQVHRLNSLADLFRLREHALVRFERQLERAVEVASELDIGPGERVLGFGQPVAVGAAVRRLADGLL